MKHPAVLRVTTHAIRRFVERGGATSEVRAEEALTKLLLAGKLVRPPLCGLKGKSAKELRITRWLRAGDWILVVEGSALVTTFPADGQWRWSA